MKIIIAITLVLIISGCASDNEHFCARYEYVYSQLSDPDLPGYNELKQQLQLEISKNKDDSEHEKFMLFVLEDHRSEIKPAHQSPKEFCVSSKRWTYYR